MERELPVRKQLRYDGINYDAPGPYFITICTHHKQATLSRIVGANHDSPVVELTARGKIVERAICQMAKRFGITMEAYVIMPNHVHLLLALAEREERAIHESPLQGRSTLSKAIGYMKMTAARDIRAACGDDAVWQRGYFDHVIRDRRDYDEHVAYITENPLRWRADELYVAE